MKILYIRDEKNKVNDTSKKTFLKNSESKEYIFDNLKKLYDISFNNKKALFYYDKIYKFLENKLKKIDGVEKEIEEVASQKEKDNLKLKEELQSSKEEILHFFQGN